MARASSKYTSYKRAAKAKPKRVIEEYHQHVKCQLNVRPGDRWSYRDWWKNMPYGRIRSVGRVAYLLCEMLDGALEGPPAYALYSFL